MKLIFTEYLLGFPGGSAGKESACDMGNWSSIPGMGRSPGEGKGYPLQYSGLENSMDCIVHGVAKNQTRLRDFHFTSLPGLNTTRPILLIYSSAQQFKVVTLLLLILIPF